MIRLLAPLLLLLAPCVYGEVTFSGLDLSPANHLLFQARADAPTYGSYSTLFAANLDNRTMRQLTFFPEQVALVGPHKELQIQNRFGVFRTNAALKDMRAVAAFPSFVTGHGIETGKIATASASPNGTYLLYLQQTDFGHGKLVLYSTATGKRVTVATGLGYTLSQPPARWAPDSSYFIYSKDDKLYYYSLDQLKQNRVMEASLRMIGKGTIANVRWGADGNLYYVVGSLVYRIAGPELFTRSLYSGLLAVGTIAGKIPFSFNSSLDRFWISPDGGSILLAKGGRNLFLYLLHANDYQPSGRTRSLPYLLLPRNTRVKNVLWSHDGLVTLLTHSITGKSNTSDIFRLNLFAPNGTPSFHQVKSGKVRSIVLSPDGRRAAVLEAGHVIIHDYRSWNVLRSFAEPDPLHALWLSSDRLIVAGRWFTDLLDLSNGGRRLVSLSQPGAYGFASSSGEVETRLKGRKLGLVDSGGTPGASAAAGGPKSGGTSVTGNPGGGGSNSASDAGRSGQSGGAGRQGRAAPLIRVGSDGGSAGGAGATWTSVSNYSVGKPVVASPRFRVYTDTAESMSYTNIVMVRKVVGEGTQPLFPYPATRYQAFPTKAQPVSFTDFTHGSRIRRREVALVFNAVGSVEGLTTILNTLREYHLKCTFFINGEFMRRNPGAVKELATSGQQVGSLFFAYFDMTDSRYKIDPSFVRQGLARTEDDYYALTGKELSLLWHAPHYTADSMIIDAARKMNYTYVGRDVQPLDWVTKSDGLRGSGLYLSAADIIDRIMKQKEPGSIIPIRIGKLDRSSFLWNRLDVLINDLISLGYSIVPVTTLMQHAR